MSAHWSEGQRRCLAALGYTLYRPVAPEVVLTEPAPATTKEDRLATALLRAAGLDPAGIADAASWLLAQGMPPTLQLRTDPVAKRALWPRLRALRTGRVPP